MKKVLFLTFAFLLLPFYLAVAAVGYDNSSTAVFNGTTGASWSHTVTGTNSAIICSLVNWEYAGVPTVAITYNSVALTSAGSVASNRAIRMYYRATGTGAGTPQTVAFTLSAEANVISACSSFTGAHQTTPVGTAVTSTDIATGINVTIPSGGMAYDVAYMATGDSGTCDTLNSTASGQTQVIDLTTECIPGSFEGQIGASTRTSGSSFTWTDHSGTYDDGMVGVPISQAAAAAVVRRRAVVVQ